MRYMIITYMQRSKGRGQEPQQDELVAVAKRLKARDISEASVILDFQTRQVIKASVGDQVAPREFRRIRDYYHQHYAEIIDQLEKIYHEKQDNPS